MIRLLCGENDFMVMSEQARLIGEYLSVHNSLGLERIDCTQTDGATIRDALLQLPFLVEKKLVVLSAPFSSKQHLELLEELLPQVPDDIEVLMVDAKADKRTRLYKYLHSGGFVQEFAVLKGAALAQWATEYAAKQSTELSRQNAELLIDRVGSLQMILAREIEKLSVDKVITPEIIMQRTDQQLHATIFELLDAIFAGKTTAVFGIYEELLAQKVDPAEIISLISWQLAIFATVQYAEPKDSSSIARSAKIHPFVVGKALNAVSRISRQALKDAITMALDADLQLKTSSGFPEDVMRVLLLKLTSLQS